MDNWYQPRVLFLHVDIMIALYCSISNWEPIKEEESLSLSWPAAFLTISIIIQSQTRQNKVDCYVIIIIITTIIK